MSKQRVTIYLDEGDALDVLNLAPEGKRGIVVAEALRLMGDEVARARDVVQAAQLSWLDVLAYSRNPRRRLPGAVHVDTLVAIATLAGCEVGRQYIEAYADDEARARKAQP